MDLIDVLIDVSMETRDNDVVVSLGNTALDAYYDDLFERYLAGHAGQKLVRATLNFVLQQLATRSRADRTRERYLQIGSFNPADLAAGLLQAMPQTQVQWVPGFTDITAAETDEVVDAVRTELPPDGMPHEVAITSQDWQTLAHDAAPGTYGLIAVFSERNIRELADHVAVLRRLLNPRGRVIVFETLTGGRRPTELPGPDFAGRYLMTGAGTTRTISIAVLPAETSVPA